MPSLVWIHPVVWEENGDKQTNKQTDTPFCFIYKDILHKKTHIKFCRRFIVVCHFRESTVEFVNRCHYLLVISIRVCKLVRYVGSANIDLHGYTAVE